MPANRTPKHGGTVMTYQAYYFAMIIISLLGFALRGAVRTDYESTTEALGYFSVS